MNEERMEILKMVAAKVISPEEGERLLNALNDGESSSRRPRRPHRPERPEGPGPRVHPRHRPEEDWDREDFFGQGNPFDHFGKMMDQFGSKFGRKMEKWGEKFGNEISGFFEEFGEAMEHPEDINIDVQMNFEGDFPGWEFDKTTEAEDLDFTDNDLDLSGIDGVMLKTRRKSGSLDFTIRPSEDALCHFSESSVVRAYRKGTWAVITFADDSEVSLPDHIERLSVFAANGDIDLEDVDAELSVKTLNGDLLLKGLKQSTRAVSLNGDLDLEFHPAFKGEMRVNTLHGDIRCLIPESAGVEFTGRTLKGDLNASGPGTVIKAQYRRPANIFMTGIVGREKGNTLRMDTLNGDIQIESDGSGDFYGDMPESDVSPAQTIIIENEDNEISVDVSDADAEAAESVQNNGDAVDDVSTEDQE